MRALVLVLRLLLGAVFVYAAYTKLSQPWMLFAMSIDAYQILPPGAALFLGHWLPWLELSLGLFLIAGIFLRHVAFATAGLLVIFFALMIRAFVKGMSIDCGCFGLGEAISIKTLLRDGLLVAAAIALTILTRRRDPDRRVAAPSPIEVRS